MRNEKIGIFVFPVKITDGLSYCPCYGQGKFFIDKDVGFEWQEEQNEKENGRYDYWTNQLIRYE